MISKPAAALLLFLSYPTALSFVPATWPMRSFQLVAMTAAAVTLGWSLLRKKDSRFPILAAVPALLALLQISIGSTAYTHASLVSALHWGSLAATLYLASVAVRTDIGLTTFLTGGLALAAVHALLCLTQLFTSEGRVLWIFDSGFPDVYGTFPSGNNFAQWAELFLPVAVWNALRSHGHRFWYASAAGFLFASIIATASRAGTLLAVIESLACMAIFLARQRQPYQSQRALIVLMIPAIAVVAALVVGWDTLWQRFQQSDPLSVRRELLISAFEMAKAKPILGHGIGTFSFVYPQYAVTDLPVFVNAAHNDWAEFAADGGFVLPIVVLAMFLPAATAIWRRPWALGVLAVCVHAWVDFPFPRIGVSAWLFAFVAVASAPLGERAVALSRRSGLIAAFALALFACGAFLAARIGYADLLYEMDTARSISIAKAIYPGNAAYHARLADLDPDESARDRHIAEAIRINPRDAGALIRAGLRAEERDSRKEAERLLIEASRYDRTWQPRWSLANFYFRTGQEEKFWKSAAEAIQLANYRALPPLFELAVNMNPNVTEVAERLLPHSGGPASTSRTTPVEQSGALRQWTQFLLSSGSIEGVEQAALRLTELGSPATDRDTALQAVAEFIRRDLPEPALKLWKSLAARGWIGTGSLPAPFPKTQLPHWGFDWRYYSPQTGISILPGDGQVTVLFDGKQDDIVIPIEEFLPVQPGESVQLQGRYSLDSAPNALTGLKWRIVEGDSAVAESAMFVPGKNQTAGVVLAPSRALIRVQLVCARPRAASRLEGSLTLHDFSLQVHK